MIPQRRGMEIENITLKELIQIIESLDDEHIQISDYYKTYDLCSLITLLFMTRKHLSEI